MIVQLVDRLPPYTDEIERRKNLPSLLAASPERIWCFDGTNWTRPFLKDARHG